MNDPLYGRARRLQHQRSTPNTTLRSLQTTTPNFSLLSNPAPPNPLTTMFRPLTPMIQLPNGDHISLPDLMDLVTTQRFSSPPHFYHAPTIGPEPIFRNGRDRFPIWELHWHSATPDNSD